MKFPRIIGGTNVIMSGTEKILGDLTINDIATAIILAIFAYHVVQGYRKGFIKQAAFVINTILALILAPIAMPIFYEVLKQLDVINQVEKYIQKFLEMYYYSHTASGVRLEPSITDSTLVAVDAIALKIINQNAGVIAGNIVRTTSYSMGFIAVRLVLHFVLNVSAFIAALPIIHQFDKAIGAISGGVMTLLSIWIIVTLLSLLSFIPIVDSLNNMIMQLPIMQNIRTINPFELLVKAVEGIESIR